MGRRQGGRPGTFAPSWLGLSPEERTLWQRLPVGPDPDRLWGRMATARTLVAVALLLLEVLLWQQGSTPAWLPAAALAYLATTLVGLRWGRPRPGDAYWSPGWLLTLWVDLAMFATLQFSRPEGIDYAPLFVLPVLWAATLGPLALALGSAACATLVLLGQAMQQWLTGPSPWTPNFLQGALTGSGLFLVALLANQLSQRLARERTMAQRSQVEARLQSEVNDLVVGGLKEGVLVLDEHGDIWHANPAAIDMLGLGDTSPDRGNLTDSPAGAQLLDRACAALRHGEACAFHLGVPQESGRQRELQIRLQPTTRTGAEGLRVAVLFLEDQREIEARIRNEKLAAMGRLSAAVAHEIRNPLAAISQANALLAEQALPAPQQRLSTMIGQNARRIGRTVDDILDLARDGTTPALDVASLAPLDTLLRDIVRDWQQGQPGVPVQLQAGAADRQAWFDPEHLRRVVVNLLDNARKHGRSPAGRMQAVVRTAAPTDGRVALTVWSPGPALTPTQHAQLFEPFSSTDSRSSGLGLYICRELCRRHDAQIDHQAMVLDGQTGNAFTVHMRSLPPAHSLT